MRPIRLEPGQQLPGGKMNPSQRRFLEKLWWPMIKTEPGRRRLQIHREYRVACPTVCHPNPIVRAAITLVGVAVDNGNFWVQSANLTT
jgi:hypothetical protein